MYRLEHNWIKPFLPVGSELVTTESQPKRALLLIKDLDGDGIDEIVGVLRLYQQLYLFLLKKHNENYQFITMLKGTGYQVSYLGIDPIKGQGKLSIIVGWQVGAIWSQLSVYELVETGLKEERLNGDFSYSKIEITDMPGQYCLDGQAEIALWKHDTGEAYRVEIYRWQDNQLVPAKDVEPYYFKKVAAYYKQKIKEHPDYLFYYPYLQDAELKASFETRAVYLFPASVKEIGGSKWGYIDAKGKFILPPIYEHTKDFQENGLAIILLADKSGIIDHNGYFIVQPKYDTIKPFSEGRAVAVDKQGFKVIDNSGKEITAKAYSYVEDYQEGRAIAAVTNEQGEYVYGYLNRMGKEILPPQYESASKFNDGKAVVQTKEGSFALISLTGKVLNTFEFASVGDYGEGLMSFQTVRGGRYGFINALGKTIIKPQYSFASPFKNGRAIVSVTTDEKVQYGLIDDQGNFIIKPDYNSLKELNEGRYAIGKAINPEKPYRGSEFALADADGHLLTGFIYNEISKFTAGFASAYNDQFTFVIDQSGKRVELLPMVNGSGTLTFDKTLIKGEIDFRLVYFDESGKEIWKHNKVIPLNSRYQVAEFKYRPNIDYLVYYPQINGLNKVNQLLKDLAEIKEVPAHKELEFNYFGDFEVSFFKKDLVVIEITGYHYPFGAAHGIPIKKYAHISIKRDRLFELKDLLKAGYVKKISGIIADQIKSNEKYSYVFQHSYKGIHDDQPFFIDESGLNIYFDPYEIAPFAAGFPTFTIPLDEIHDILNTSGEFWVDFH